MKMTVTIAIENDITRDEFDRIMKPVDGTLDNYTTVFANKLQKQIKCARIAEGIEKEAVFIEGAHIEFDEDRAQETEGKANKV
ncbi:MAG: hypothetical protein U0I48_02530 [Acutalibacteraceae bacterium]|nr:hypothetical protein [Acutalibacteraceae bacterium]